MNAKHTETQEHEHKRSKNFDERIFHWENLMWHSTASAASHPPPKVLLLTRELESLQFTVSWANLSPYPTHFCRAHGCYRQASRKTNRPHYSVCSNAIDNI